MKTRKLEKKNQSTEKKTKTMEVCEMKTTFKKALTLATAFTMAFSTLEVPVIASYASVSAATSASATISFDVDALVLTEGDTFTLLPATGQAVSWSSSDTSIATVSSTGEVTAISKGDCIITATASDGSTASYELTVNLSWYPSSIALNCSTKEITVGDTATLTATTTPSEVLYPTVTWASSDESVATVSSSGVVTGVSEGTATITATTKNSKTATCTVTVNSNTTAVTSISLSSSSRTGYVGYTTLAPTVTVTPSDATDQTITWSSSDTSIATVDSSTGKVKGVSNGTCTITATSSNGKTASYTLTIKTRYPSAISLDFSIKSITVGDTATLTATLTPSEVVLSTVTWASSDTSVATVSSSGVVTGVSEGTATITATTANSKTATCTVTVESSTTAVTSISLSSSSRTGYVGYTTLAPTVTVTPSDATDQTITWSSSDTSIATVDSSTGKVKGVSNGTCTITATSSNGKTASYTLTIKTRYPSAISLDFSIKSITVGDTATLTATLTPSEVVLSTVTWASSDTSVATVSSSGVVTGVSEGTATITATTKNGLTATCKVTVNAKSTTSISLNRSSAAFYTNYYIILTATVTSDTVSVDDITWTTSDSTVIKITDKGNGQCKCAARSAGTATVTATTSDGYSASCTFTIKNEGDDDEATVTLDKTSITTAHSAGSFKILTATASDGYVGGYTWTTTDAGVVTVNGNSNSCTIGMIGTGTATVTVTLDNGNSASCTINSTSYASGMSFISYASTMDAGDTQTVVADTVNYPSSTKGYEIYYKTSTSSILSVDQTTGEITALKAGTGSVTAYSSDGKTSATVTIYVNAASNNITVTTNAEDGEIDVTKGKTYTLKYTLPSGVTISSYSFANGYATISSSGVITGVTNGRDILTITLSNGVTRKVIVNVIPTASEQAAMIAEFQQEMLDIINEERAAEGLSAVVLDSTLCEAAQIRSDEILSGWTISHTRPDGTSWATALTEVGIDTSKLSHGENIAFTNLQRNTAYTATTAMTSLMASDGHRVNILGSSWTKVGIGVTYCTKTCSYVFDVVQIFTN